MIALNIKYQNSNFGSKCLKDVEKLLMQNNIRCEIKKENTIAYRLFKKMDILE